MLDFKRLSKSEGYKSLKNAVIKDCYEVNNCFNIMGCNNKKTNCTHKYCNKFKFVIDLLKKFKIKYNIDEVIVLNAWEKKRSYWYMNYYQEYSTNILLSDALKACGFDPNITKGIS